jgi:hypothetical protein
VSYNKNDIFSWDVRLSVVFIGGSRALSWKYVYKFNHVFTEINASSYTGSLSESKNEMGIGVVQTVAHKNTNDFI